MLYWDTYCNIKTVTEAVVKKIKADNPNKIIVDNIMVINENVIADIDEYQMALFEMMTMATMYCQENESIVYTLSQVPTSTAGIVSFVNTFVIAKATITAEEIVKTEYFKAIKEKVDNYGYTILAENCAVDGITIINKIALKVSPNDKISGIQNAVNSVITSRAKEKKILLVEDNELSGELSCEVLKKVGFDVTLVNDGESAVEKIKAGEEYDIILMDIVMPRMDGYEATRKIREMGCKSFIFALSSNAMETDKKRALESGMDGHFAKPLDAKTLSGVMLRLK